MKAGRHTLSGLQLIRSRGACCRWSERVRDDLPHISLAPHQEIACLTNSFPASSF